MCRDINNGVYRAGFATSQEAYDKAVREVFAGLDRVEGILSGSRYLTGPTITEADIRLYTTLVRFDMVYVGHFKVFYMVFCVVFWSVKAIQNRLMVAMLLVQETRGKFSHLDQDNF